MSGSDELEPNPAMLADTERPAVHMSDRGARPTSPEPSPDDTQRPTDAGDEELAVERKRDLEHGSRVGRHVLLRCIGKGGMGIVHAAYDPELDRKVAVKLLIPDSAGSSARARLLREAQALAKLSHPNVVAIHDM